MKKSLVWLLVVFGCLMFVRCDDGEGTGYESPDDIEIVAHQYEVEYRVEGRHEHSVDVSFDKENGDMEIHSDCRLPYSYKFKTYDACVRLHISVRNGGFPYMSSIVYIIVDGQVVSESKATGAYSDAIIDCEVDWSECRYQN